MWLCSALHCLTYLKQAWLLRESAQTGAKTHCFCSKIPVRPTTILYLDQVMEVILAQSDLSPQV